MTWQKVVGHINNSRIEVESKDGNRYPADTEYDHLNEMVYTQQVNSADNKTYWAWVTFDDDTPSVDEVRTGAPEGGPPKNPPGER
jgi:hypothetical protein